MKKEDIEQERKYLAKCVRERKIINIITHLNVTISVAMLMGHIFPILYCSTKKFVLSIAHSEKASEISLSALAMIGSILIFIGVCVGFVEALKFLDMEDEKFSVAAEEENQRLEISEMLAHLVKMMPNYEHHETGKIKNSI